MKVLLSEEQLRAGIARVAEQIRQRYAGRPLTLVGYYTLLCASPQRANHQATEHPLRISAFNAII